MARKPNQRNEGPIRPLRNVLGTYQLVMRLQDRAPHLPNIGVVYGYSGLGKSFAATYVQNKTRAVRVEIGDSWSRKTFIQAVLLETGAPALRGTTADLVREAILRLADQPQRPLLIDEADKLVDRGYVETVREIADAAQVPVVLFGEERLPAKLETVERVHNRVLVWYGALACDAGDVRQLAQLYLPGIEVADSLLELVRQRGKGRARYICSSLAAMAQFALEQGHKALDEDRWRDEPVSGDTPRPRPDRLASLTGDAS